MPRFTILSLALVLLTLFSWLSFKRKEWRLSTTFLQSKYALCFWVFLFSGLLASFLAINPVEAYWMIAKDFLFMALMILLPAVFEYLSNWQAYFFKGFLVAVLMSSLIGFYQLKQEVDLITVQDLDLYSLNSTFSHRNLWAAFLVLSLPFIAYSLYSFRNFWRVLGIILLANNLFWIYFLESRSSWLALGVFGISFILFWALGKSQFRISALFNRVAALILGLILLIGFGFYYISAQDELQAQELGFDMKLENASEKSFTVQERVLLWKGTGLMIQDNSLLGVGPGNWKIHFPKYGSDIWRARQGLVQFQRPHNDFLWVLSEQGFIGGISYLFMFLTMIFLGLKNQEKRKLDKKERILNRLILAGIMAYLAISFFSFPKERIAHQWILFVFFSMLIYYFFKDKEKLRIRKNWAQVFLSFSLLVGGFCYWIGLERWMGEIYTKTILSYNSTAQWQQMSGLSNRVKQSPFYKMDPSSVPISFYEGLAELNQNYSNRALELFEEAEKVHPNMIHVLNNIAAAHVINKDFDEAIKFYQKALTISPKYQDGILNMVATYFNANRVGEAYDFLLIHQSSFPENDENYRAFTLSIIQVIQKNLADSIEDERLKNSILQLNDEWLKQIHNKVILDSIPLEKRLIMDAIYRMEILENTISMDEAVNYKNLYLNN